MKGSLLFAALPLALAVGCGSSSHPATKAAARPTSGPSLDQQGQIFCTLIDKVNASFTAPDASTPLAGLNRFGDELKAATAALSTGNRSIRSFSTGVGSTLATAKGADEVTVVSKARQVCEAQGWVGNP